MSELVTTPPQTRRIPWWLWLAVASLLAGLTAGFLQAIEKVREAAARSMCNLSQVALAIHNYHDTHGHLPPAALCNSDGKPLLSWRVLILPYIEEQKLYDEFKLDEPWDSDHNIRLLSRMPKTYGSPWHKVVKVPPNHTVLHVFVGPGTPFEPGKKIRLSDGFPKGTSNTLMFVEAGDPVPWTKPEEIGYATDQPIRLQGLFKNGFRAGMVDAGRTFITPDMDEAELRAMITCTK